MYIYIYIQTMLYHIVVPAWQLPKIPLGRSHFGHELD